MNTKYAISALAATFALAGAAEAGDRNHKNKRDKRDRAESSATVLGAGAAAATRDGAIAGGLSGGAATSMTQGRPARRAAEVITPNAAQTNSSGAVYTTRRSASAAVNTNGSAVGTGAQSTGSTVDAYGETNMQGSNADIYGDSVANSGD
jgi:hypothetical protein